MRDTVSKKYVIFVGKKTVNGMLFRKGKRPVSFPQRTINEEFTEQFFNTNELNDQYINKIIETINSFIDIFQKSEKCELKDISIYAASEFSVSLSEDEKIFFKMKIFSETGVHAFILSKELERLYIENIIPNYTEGRFVVRIMSTATVLYSISDTGKMSQIRFEKLGTATIASQLKRKGRIRKKISEKMSKEFINECIESLKKNIQKTISNATGIELNKKMVLYLGGEINFLKALNYDLDKNNLFSDPDHKYMISYDSFFHQSIAKVLSKTQDELNEEALNLDMAWKEGIKPCTLIALALFKVLGIQIIVPSNKKEFEGMHYKNFQNIVITGSRQKNGFEIEEWVEHFKGHGINVYSPQITKNSKDNLVMEEAKHLQAVCKCDTLIVCNSNADGYIGDSTLFDIGYAIAKEKRVITTSMPQKDVFEQIAVEVGIYEEK